MQIGDSTPNGIYIGDHVIDGKTYELYASEWYGEAQWSLEFGEVGGLTKNDGYFNTQKLVGDENKQMIDIMMNNGQHPYPAAYLCASLRELGHDDWYLPSEEELAVMHEAYKICMKREKELQS